MFNEIDFDEAAADISERVSAVRDPLVMATVEKWLVKLTADDRGVNELHYLKLLQYMLADKRIGRPFVRAPPEGPLLPISAYLNPASYGGLNWDTSSSSSIIRRRRLSVSVKSSTPAGDSEDDVGNHDEDVVSVSTTDFLDPTAGNERTVFAKRNGHLAGGECSSCWGAKSGETGRKSGGATGVKNPFAKLCNPCLDGLGRHVRKAEPGPLDEVYRELLGDCALPVFTESERKSVSPELLRALESVNDATTLQDFYFQVSLFTCDQGALLIRSSGCMMDDFKAFTSDVFESRAEHISNGLANEQMVLNDKYAYLRDREMNRATVAMDYLRSVCPRFDWHKYQADPEPYMKRLVATSGDAAGDGSAKPGGADNEDDDGERQQSMDVKKLLYSLNWLRTEVTRAECEGQRLQEQRNALSAELSDLNCLLSADRSRAAADVKRHNDELAILCRRTADQDRQIDQLMETIQLLIQNKSGAPSASC